MASGNTLPIIMTVDVEFYHVTMQQWLHELKEITRRLAKFTSTVRTLKNAVGDEFVETEKPALGKLEAAIKKATQDCASAHVLLMAMESDAENFRKAKILSEVDNANEEDPMIAITSDRNDPMICATEEEYVRSVASASMAANASPSRSASRSSYPY